MSERNYNFLLFNTREKLCGELTCKTAPWVEVKNVPTWKTEFLVLMAENEQSHSPYLKETISLSVRASQTFVKKKKVIKVLVL